MLSFNIAPGWWRIIMGRITLHPQTFALLFIAVTIAAGICAYSFRAETERTKASYVKLENNYATLESNYANAKSQISDIAERVSFIEGRALRDDEMATINRADGYTAGYLDCLEQDPPAIH